MIFYFACMKNNIFASILALCLVLTVQSCKDKHTCPQPNLTAQINVSPFNSCTITTHMVGNRLQIEAKEDEERAYRSIMLLLPNRTGQFTIGEQGVDDTYASTSLAGLQPVDYYSDSIRSGTLLISKFDTLNHLTSGTFSFAAYDQTGINGIKTVTEGVFTDVKW
jgi:hypothetical protein